MMRRLLPIIALLLLLIPGACAETVDQLWDQLPVAELEQFSEDTGISFAQLAKDILSGEMSTLSEWPEKIMQAVRQTVESSWLQVTGIIGCALICRFAHAFAGSRSRAHMALDLLCRVAGAITLLSVTVAVTDDVAAVCGRLRSFTDTAAPVLIAALTLTGSPAMAAAITPSAVAADSMSVFLSTNVGIPLIRIAAVLAAFSGIGSRFRLDRLFRLCVNGVKWMLGCCMTGFLALMSVRSITLGGKDSATVQTVRFAVDNLLPIIGGELADTVSSVIASAALVKNAAGIAICAALVAMALLPLVRLATIALMLKLASASLEMLAVNELPAAIDRFAQVIDALMAILAASAALGMILAGAVVFTVGARM